jgi:hypothetical protein
VLGGKRYAGGRVGGDQPVFDGPVERGLEGDERVVNRLRCEALASQFGGEAPDVGGRETAKAQAAEGGLDPEPDVDLIAGQGARLDVGGVLDEPSVEVVAEEVAAGADGSRPASTSASAAVSARSACRRLGPIAALTWRPSAARYLTL